MKDESWERAMALAKEANLEMLRGNPQPLKLLSSHRDDGTYRQEDVSAIVGSDLALTVTIERYTVRIDRAPRETAHELRVTQVFRREGDAWKLVHRHGDPLVRKQEP
jgi:ketosteroid isomerase-like protein